MRQISINSLKTGDIIGRTLYSSNGRVLLSSGVKLTPLYISRLQDMGIHIIYIEDEKFKDLVIEDVVSEENRREAASALRKSAESIKVGKNFNENDLQKAVKRIVEDIIFKENMLINVTDMRSADDTLMAHSVNVCVLATVLGKAMGLDKEKLETVAVGALLHDIGKVQLESKLSKAVESKKVSNEETEVYKTHTNLGFEELRKRKDLSVLIAHIAFQHHERMDGTGYPRKLRGNDIHPLGQIVGIANTYDNLTNSQNNGKLIMPHEACEIMMGMADRIYPLEMIRQFIRNIAAYPTGLTVRLNNNEIGVVVDQNLSMPTRPIVRVYDELGVSDMREYNMVKERTLFIDKVLT